MSSILYHSSTVPTPNVVFQLPRASLAAFRSVSNFFDATTQTPFTPKRPSPKQLRPSRALLLNVKNSFNHLSSFTNSVTCKDVR